MAVLATFPDPIHLFEMRGRDTRDFLHRLTTVNVRAMQVGDFTLGFFLNPQGKIRAAFRMACASEDRFLLEVEGGKNSAWRDALQNVISEFTFSEQYELRELSAEGAMKSAWLFHPSGDQDPSLRSKDGCEENCSTETDGLWFFHGSRKTFDRPWTSVWGTPEKVGAYLRSLQASPLSEGNFEELRVLALAPKVDHELTSAVNPLEIGLRDGIADEKGCYPGQEVIEKIISLGAPARRLALLEGQFSAQDFDSARSPDGASEMKVLNEEGSEVGVLTSACFRELPGEQTKMKTFHALALLRRTALQEGKTLRLGSASHPLIVKLERIAPYGQ